MRDVVRAEKPDLDWNRGVARVRGTKTTFRDRLVPITPLTEALLRHTEKFGMPFTPWKYATCDLRKVARRVGLAHFCAKDLRRTHGQWLGHAGVAPHLIGKILGHANSVMAERVYAQGDDLEIARLVRTALDAAPTQAPAPPPLLPPAGSST